MIVMPDQIDLLELEQRWPSPIVARSAAAEFSGGTVCAGTLANADSRGEGPEGLFYIGKRAAYPARSLRIWLEKRTTKDRKRAV